MILSANGPAFCLRHQRLSGYLLPEALHCLHGSYRRIALMLGLAKDTGERDLVIKAEMDTDPVSSEDREGWIG